MDGGVLPGIMVCLLLEKEGSTSENDNSTHNYIKTSFFLVDAVTD